MPSSDFPASRRLKLLVVSQAGFRGYELPARGTISLGRSSKSDLHIDDPSITRAHAKLHIESGRVEIEDLGSVNGTRVRDRRIDAGRRTSIARGEAFRLGTVLLIVHPVDEEPPASSPVAPEEIATRRQTPTHGSAPAPEARAHVIDDPGMIALYALIDRLAAGNINVLITGETGVGKELVAERLHQQSRRRASPFVKLNCAAVTETLLEAELFGYERGAFTGATQAKPGLLEAASGGTFFFDEVGEMPLALQAKLLRAIESRQVLRVGALAPRAIDVRFVAATNRDLESRVHEGTFREDLYFRLNGALIAVPPLRERVREIRPLAEVFLRATSPSLDRRPPTLSVPALLMLEQYEWPGNVRELRNFVERAVLVAPGDELLPEHFPVQRMASKLPLRRIGAASDPPDPPSRPAVLDRDHILAVLSQCGGNQSRAAKALGISRTTLVTRLNEYGVPRPRKA